MALEEIATVAETLAQDLAKGGHAKKLYSAANLPMRLLIPLNYFKTFVEKVNHRNIRTGWPFMVILQLAFEQLVESHMRSLQVLLAMGTKGKGQVVNFHHVEALALVTRGRFDTQGQRAYIEGLSVAGGQKRMATSKSVAKDSQKLMLENKCIKAFSKHLGVKFAPPARQLLGEEYASLLLQFFSDCVEESIEYTQLAPKDVVLGLRAEAYRYAGYQ